LENDLTEGKRGKGRGKREEREKGDAKSEVLVGDLVAESVSCERTCEKGRKGRTASLLNLPTGIQGRLLFSEKTYTACLRMGLTREMLSLDDTNSLDDSLRWRSFV